MEARLIYVWLYECYNGGVQPLWDLVLTDEIFLILSTRLFATSRENVVMRCIFPAFFIKFNNL